LLRPSGAVRRPRAAPRRHDEGRDAHADPPAANLKAFGLKGLNRSGET
jgi:hypothetical protein